MGGREAIAEKKGKGNNDGRKGKVGRGERSEGGKGV